MCSMLLCTLQNWQQCNHRPLLEPHIMKFSYHAISYNNLYHHFSVIKINCRYYNYKNPYIMICEQYGISWTQTRRNGGRMYCDCFNTIQLIKPLNYLNTTQLLILHTNLEEWCLRFNPEAKKAICKMKIVFKHDFKSESDYHNVYIRLVFMRWKHQ